MFMKILKLIALSVITSSLLLFSGCSSSSDDDPFIRVLHAGPTVAPVNIEVNGIRVASNLSYGQYVDYAQTDREQVIIDVLDTASSQNIYTSTANLSRGETYTFFLSGTAGAPGSLLTLDSSTRASLGDIAIRTINMAPATNLLDIYITGPGRLLVDEDPNVTNLPYRGSTGYLTFDRGEGEFRVRGTTPFQKTAIVDSGLIELTERSKYTLVALESFQGGAPYSFVILRDR